MPDESKIKLGVSAASKRVTSKQVECPTCGAQPGESCRGSAYSGRSHRSAQSHHLRIDAARKANGDERGRYDRV